MKKPVLIVIVLVTIFTVGYILADVFLPSKIKESDVSVAKLETELVCMVNDAFMGIKQFPVPLGDKMYFGCCEQCVDKIKNNRHFRYAKDPQTGEEVDKALAFIVLKSEEDHSVYYFKSKENYYKFKSSAN